MKTTQNVWAIKQVMAKILTYQIELKSVQAFGLYNSSHKTDRETGDVIKKKKLFHSKQYKLDIDFLTQHVTFFILHINEKVKLVTNSFVFRLSKSDWNLTFIKSVLNEEAEIYGGQYYVFILT